jgi:SAM-dependent methyltransferase
LGAAATNIEVRIAPAHPHTGCFRELDGARSGPHEYFAELLRADPRLRGRVLDIGCGADFPRSRPVREVLAACARLDGVEPDPSVTEHPGLVQRWCCTIEDADLPSAAYDAAVTFWVVEHIRRPDAFLRKAIDALRPGGALYAFTPHSLHPFALISRTIQAVQLKGVWHRASRKKINEYPAYYRLNRRGRVVAAARRAGFASAEIHYLPCLQWDTYFPRALRFAPHLYDRVLGARFPRAAQILVFKLEKGEETRAG